MAILLIQKARIQRIVNENTLPAIFGEINDARTDGSSERVMINADGKIISRITSWMIKSPPRRKLRVIAWSRKEEGKE